MYELKQDDIYADEITDAYESYEKEIEVKILVEISPDLQEKKYGVKLPYDAELYILATIHKDLRTLSHISTEYTDSYGIHLLNANYSQKELDMVKKYALKKWYETF